MANTFAISVVGKDEPGIIAAISKTLLELNCNLADTNMSVLNGYFAMVIMAQTHSELSPERLSTELKLLVKDFDLVFSVQALRDVRQTSKQSSSRLNECVTVSVYGIDKPGIVHGVTAAIANTNSNIIDLRTQQSDQPNALYSLFMEVELAKDETIENLDFALRAVQRQFGVQVALQDLATAEL